MIYSLTLGAFLIPFLICLLLAGIPLFFIELSVGQFTQAGPLKAWKDLCPLVGGEYLHVPTFQSI